MSELQTITTPYIVHYTHMHAALTIHAGPLQPQRATHAHSAQDADPRRAEALRWLLRRLCHRLVRLPRQEQWHGRARYLGQKGVEFTHALVEQATSYSRISHSVPHITVILYTYCLLPSLPQLYLYAACGQAPQPCQNCRYISLQVPLVRYADWGISIPLMLYQLCDLGGAAAMLKVPAAVLVLYTARPHTPRPPRARSVCVAALASAPHPRAGERHRVACLQSALFQGLCSGTARRQAAPRSSHAVTPPPHTAHTLLFHNIKARTPPAPCS